MNRIAECLKDKRMSQHQLAVRVGIAEQTLIRYKRGIGYPRVDVAYAMCDALGVRLEDLFPREDMKERCAGGI